MNCECGDPTRHTGHCGCCGAPITNTEWCLCCTQHVGPAHLPPWERTWFAQYGTECPDAPSEYRDSLAQAGRLPGAGGENQ